MIDVADKWDDGDMKNALLKSLLIMKKVLPELE
jgi:hypothetical protein